MTRNDCARAETLAGAIALEEATDGERDAYRRHLSACARCVETLGGEREIERVMSVVAQARDEESWEPDLRSALRDRTRMRRNAWKLGLGVGTAALAVSLGIHLLAAGAVRPVALVPTATIANANTLFHVSLEKRTRGQTQNVAAPPVAVTAASAPRHITVTHNVVALAAPRVANPRPAKVNQPADATRAGLLGADPAIVAALPPSEKQKGSIDTMQTQSGAPTYANRAESIAVTPDRAVVVRDVAPIGGKLTLPNPPAIAAREMAAEGLDEATSTFALAVDERGVPMTCVIQKSSGIVAIDESVCRAAMQARFAPRTVNGKPTTSIYRDAFVFLSNPTNEP